MTEKLKFIILLFTIVGCTSAGRPEKYETSTDGQTFINNADSSINILYDHCYLLSVSVFQYENENYIGTTFHYYRRNGDTLFLRDPALNSTDWDQINTKYFSVNRTDGSETYAIEPWVLIDSLLKIPVNENTTIVSAYAKLDTLLIQRNKIVRLKDFR